jgi:hypothetical protein
MLVLQPALLAFAGIATFVHYNDERRAVPFGKSFPAMQLYVVF